MSSSLADACCTCATLLSDVKVPYDPNSEKPLLRNRTLPCCGRLICALCQYKNVRFQTYCPFCQISTEPTALPTEGLRLPPSYRDDEDHARGMDLPPAYDDLQHRVTQVNSNAVRRPPEDTQDTVHFLSDADSLHSLSLAYDVPAEVLRRHNALYSDSLLAGRKFILVPASHYSGPALSTPPDPEEEERKNKVRRWMVATKCAEYSMALLYLKGTNYDLAAAVDAYRADETWEREHPMDAKGKNKRRPQFGGSLTGQLL